MRAKKLSGLRILCFTLSVIFSLTACGKTQDNVAANQSQSVSASGVNEESSVGEADWHNRPLNIIDDKYRTYYEIFVYSFYDSDGDGIGDLQGVIEKLDYLNDGDDTTDTDLGINGIWLMPIMPSDTYHKYDTKDYQDIDPQYGSLEDFEQLIEECHKRGIRVIIDLAMNHSSSKHPWFLEAAEYLKNLPEGSEPDLEDCPYVDYYHFSREQKSGYSPLPGSEWYYEAQFWSEMPDLNLQNQAVRKEFQEIAEFWLKQGADGFRLDAVKEYVTGSIEDNVEILTWFNDYVKLVNPDAYIVCECWMDRASYAQYYASGVDSMFDFEFADKSGLIANVVNGRQKASSYGQALAESSQVFAAYNPAYIDAPFYTNHDMGRSAGYYAGDNSLAQTKMGNAMNLLMSGNVFLYYGEELGMKGSGADENKRAPMYWSKDENTVGMCDGPDAMEDFEMKFDSLEEQSQDENSLYHYVKEAILLRNQNPEIARGEVTFYPEYSNDTFCVITKEYEGREVLLLFHTAAQTESISLEGLKLQEKGVGELDTLGELLTGQEIIQWNGDTMTMPGYSILVLGEQEVS